MEVTVSSETLVNFNQTARSYIRKDRILCIRKIQLIRLDRKMQVYLLNKRPYLNLKDPTPLFRVTYTVTSRLFPGA
jgi:hypothetical protein